MLARLGALGEQARLLGGALLGTSYDGAVFAWDEAAVHAAVSLATTAAQAASGTEPPWACGVACGELHSAASSAPGGVPLRWGEAMVLASLLARMARPREVLVHPSVAAVVSGDLLTNRARVARLGGRRIKGLRVDSRQAWRALAAAEVDRMVDPPLVGRDEELRRLLAATDVIILRADSGFGGSRMLAEVAERTKPARSLVLTPFAAIHEPLGSLRRAMAFVAATERITIPPKLHPVLDRLLGAEGVTIEEAAVLVAHQIQSRPGAPVPSLLLDDVTDLDAPSLEACSRAIELLGHSVRVVARIDGMSQLRRCLARYCDGEEVSLGRLRAEVGQALAGACTGEALEPGARTQWARRGGGTPLGIVEAVAAGIAQGELLWSEDLLSRRKRTAGDDIARPVGYWIARRAEGLRESSRDVLVALAHLGGEAPGTELLEVMQVVAPEVDLRAEILLLKHARWIRESRPGVFVLATRAQCEAILEFSREREARDWRVAVAKVLERSSGALRRAEAAQHAARAGLGEWAARLAMAAARAAVQVGLEESASTLAAFAGVQNPAGADLDLGELPIDEDVTEAVGPDALGALQGGGAPDEEDVPPTVVGVELSAASAGPAAREPMVPAPVSPAPEPVSYQGLIDAAADLRETRWVEVARRSLADGTTPEARRRGLLALARAYAADGRAPEALIHGLEALARMREAGDAIGARTCLLFLARIYEETERHADAVTLKAAAQGAG
jgi:hypothetical protein